MVKPWVGSNQEFLHSCAGESGILKWTIGPVWSSQNTICKEQRNHYFGEGFSCKVDHDNKIWFTRSIHLMQKKIKINQVIKIMYYFYVVNDNYMQILLVHHKLKRFKYLIFVNIINLYIVYACETFRLDKFIFFCITLHYLI